MTPFKFVDAGATAALPLTVSTARAEDRRTPVSAWVVSLVLLLLPGAALAGAEERCSALGSACRCSEPLNGNTYNGGSTAWEWGSPGHMFDPDDSPYATGCYPRTTGTESYCSASPGLMPVTAGSQKAYLPAGNTLSYVLRHRGDAICHITHPGFTLNRSTGTTWCMRHYRRWDASSAMPGPQDTPSPGDEPQEKVATIGAQNSSLGYFKVQISVGPQSPSGVSGQLSGGADMAFAGLGNTFPDLGNVVKDCTNNFCRFESCFDFGKDGILKTRRRVTAIAPGSGMVKTDSHTGTIAMNTTVFDPIPATGVAFFGQFTPGLIDYASHFMVADLDHEDPSFWIGPACEVEGGCTGAPPPPPPPAAPDAPILQP